MSSLIHLLLIDEAAFPTQIAGNDESTYQTLLEIVDEEAIRWQTLELNIRGFMPALEMWDALAGNSHLLPMCSFNFYPHKLIGPDADISGQFGFFPTDMVKDLSSAMAVNIDFDITTPDAQAVVDMVEAKAGELDPQAYEMVRDKYFVTFRDAAAQHKAVVVLIEE
ncbi:hypothetical protein FM037_03315 [Shewanella psychropiezotolerans]|uniref:Uncharacterized protein n=1 Tax=Shewanella psychropiezotolerans TaxID=2593655 RepID=A0ABX5WTM6_9GAMM|nr:MULTISPECIES: hypothetical protein [Shewanella]MPY24508.1 hypothetical protein [Shewanella sp. YLB-07]QDO82449.1 hypothetical protein FM037_03315 [Shewanella psychropiezotolerans]